MPKKTVPIKPQDIIGRKNKNIPALVIKVFNTLITKDFQDGQATVHQKEVVKLLVEKGLNEKEIYENNWLDVEDIFRKNGWEVQYDKPGYNESYDAFFVFKTKRAHNHCAW